ncbi:hypothetical protein BX265_2064 [Streptomyces sp. TLI_235]|nr:hypothetical protein BX265_2064 [Streptomyces sp. TLI_235]
MTADDARRCTAPGTALAGGAGKHRRARGVLPKRTSESGEPK